MEIEFYLFSKYSSVPGMKKGPPEAIEESEVRSQEPGARSQEPKVRSQEERTTRAAKKKK